MRKAAFRIGAVVAVVAALILAVVLSGTSSTTGKTAPALPPEVLVPPRVTVASLHGRPAAINFWASWCVPCRKESPDMERLYRSLHGSAGLVGVDYSDGAGSARDFIHQLGLSYPILRDPDGKVGDRYGVTGLPATAIIDARGRIVELLRGPQTKETVARALREAANS